MGKIKENKQNIRKESGENIEKTIEKLAGYGLNNLEISDLTGIKESTLRRNFGEFLTKGRANVKMKLRKKQLAVALQGNVSMLIWLGKQILGQKEKLEAEKEITILIKRKIIKEK